MKNTARARQRAAVYGVLAGLLVLIAVFAPLLTPCDPYLQDLSLAKAAPSAAHWLGTDRFGRDLLSRVIAGSRTSILSALAAVAVSAAVGTAAGVVGGWLGGVADAVLGTVSDIFLAFPGPVLALAVAGVLGGGVQNAVLALAAVSWPKYARLTRSRTVTIKATDWIRAVRMSGSGTGKIIIKHILPNLFGQLLVTAALDIGTTLTELAALSFLGLGAKSPIPEWGSMLSDARGMLADAPWLTAGPGAAVFVTVLVFNLLGDALRDCADTRRNGGEP